jgi:translation initiation factor eIF-2B subunit epsilon
MTMLLKQAAPGHRSREIGEESLFVLDADTGACLHYDSVVAFPEKKRFGLDISVMKEHATVSINYDLIDCQV